jgi:hypothetical protein
MKKIKNLTNAEKRNLVFWCTKSFAGLLGIIGFWNVIVWIETFLTPAQNDATLVVGIILLLVANYIVIDVRRCRRKYRKSAR